MNVRFLPSLLSKGFVIILLLICLFNTALAIEIVRLTNKLENEINPSITLKDSSIFVSYIWDDPQSKIDSVYFIKSTDAGKNWTHALSIGGIYRNNPNEDRESSVTLVDNSGCIYIFWRNIDEILMRKSNNGGISFDPEANIKRLSEAKGTKILCPG